MSHTHTSSLLSSLRHPFYFIFYLFCWLLVSVMLLIQCWFLERRCVYRIYVYICLYLTEGWNSAVCDFQVSVGVSLTWTEGIEIVCLFSVELWLGETPVDWVRQWDSLSSLCQVANSQKVWSTAFCVLSDGGLNACAVG